MKFVVTIESKSGEQKLVFTYIDLLAQSLYHWLRDDDIITIKIHKR